MLDGYGDKTAIEARCEAIRQAIEESTSDYDKCASLPEPSDVCGSWARASVSAEVSARLGARLYLRRQWSVSRRYALRPEGIT